MYYPDYRKLSSNLVASKDTTGNDKSEAMIAYTQLNERRMKRWDKTLKLADIQIKTIQKLKTPTTWLVLSEMWCGDAAHLLPVFNKMAEQSPNLDLRIVLRDEHEHLMNHFLTHGGKAIPKLIALNPVHEVLYTYGPRPQPAAKLIAEYRSKHGTIAPEIKEELQKWYNTDKGQTTVEELLTLIKS